ncbi:unnamed protein product [Chrysoparadoxa australica]
MAKALQLLATPKFSILCFVAPPQQTRQEIAQQDKSHNLTPTAKLYLADTYAFSSTAVVEAVQDGDAVSSHRLALNQTVFHPQGGGQPSDAGEIIQGCHAFKVAMVKQDGEGVIWHCGTFLNGSEPFKVGATVDLRIDGEARKLHARLHSAGHALDTAVKNCGFGALKPLKGFHFVEGPYVEYEGAVGAEQRDAFLKDVNAEMANVTLAAPCFYLATNPLAQVPFPCSNASVTLSLHLTPTQLIALDHPTLVKVEGDVRHVTVASLSCPCGGTHVRSTAELGEVEVTKVKVKKGNTRVSYKMR